MKLFINNKNDCFISNLTKKFWGTYKKIINGGREEEVMHQGRTDMKIEGEREKFFIIWIYFWVK